MGWGNCDTRREKVKAGRQEKLVQAENEDQAQLQHAKEREWEGIRREQNG